MAEFHRRGHYRTNASGTRYWVSAHDVVREEYFLSTRDGQKLINGQRVVAQACPSCRKPVFFYSNEHGSKVYFDSLGDPWPKHGCFVTGSAKSAKSPVGPAKKPLRPYMNAVSLDLRKQEIDEKIAAREARKKQKRQEKADQKRRQIEKQAERINTPSTKKRKGKAKPPLSASEVTAREAENLARNSYNKWRGTSSTVVEIKIKKKIVKPS